MLQSIAHTPLQFPHVRCEAGSGGAGAYKGGDGVVREVEFRCPMTVSVLSERRATQPYGLAVSGRYVQQMTLYWRDLFVHVGAFGNRCVRGSWFL